MSKEERIIKSLELLQKISLKNNSIRAMKHIPAQEGRYRKYPEDVHPALVEALKEKGFSKL